MTILFVLAALFGVLPLALTVGELTADQLDPHVARVLMQTGFTALLVFGLLCASVLIASMSIWPRRTGLVPSWLVWSGLVSALLLLAGPL